MTSLIPICACVLALAASSMALGTNFTTDEFLENQGRPEITYNDDVIPGNVMEEGGSGVTPTTPPNQCITEYKACLLEADNWRGKKRCRTKMCGCIKKQCIDIAKDECPGWCKAKLERIRICQKESKTCKSGKKGKCITEFKACLLEADNWLRKMRCRAKMCGCIKKGDNCGKTLRSCMQKAKGDADKKTTCLQAHNECKERQQGDEEWDSYTTDAAWGY